MSITLKRVKLKTAPLKITVAIPPENPQIKGYITGRAILRSKPENTELFERIDSGELSRDEDIVRALYEGFDGLGGEDGEEITGEAAFKDILEGEYSAYLVPAVSQAYYDQYGKARQGNYKR